MEMLLLNPLKVQTVISKRLAILGASGHGKVIADLAEQLGYIVQFYDDAYPNKSMIEHWPIEGTFDDLLLLDSTQVDVVVAIGHNQTRQQKITLLLDEGFTLPTLVHLSATVSQYSKIQQGSVVFAGAVVNAFAHIGKGVIINSSAVVEHDCLIGDFSHICPNAALAGGVIVGTGCWLGIGSQVKQLVELGDHCFVGAGSTVLKNIPSHVTAFGSPAIVMRHHK
jgi:sugar O-acyltransferase (sialic acid O-acetyltransferase NeuD family)